jgi:hypothetical protein
MQSGYAKGPDEFPDRVLFGKSLLRLLNVWLLLRARLDGVHFPIILLLLTAHWSAREIAKLVEEARRSLPPGMGQIGC